MATGKETRKGGNTRKRRGARDNGAYACSCGNADEIPNGTVTCAVIKNAIAPLRLVIDTRLQSFHESPGITRGAYRDSRTFITPLTSLVYANVTISQRPPSPSAALIIRSKYARGIRARIRSRVTHSRFPPLVPRKHRRHLVRLAVSYSLLGRALLAEGSLPAFRSHLCLRGAR